jgi:hypothetical protein
MTFALTITLTPIQWVSVIIAIVCVVLIAQVLWELRGLGKVIRQIQGKGK